MADASKINPIRIDKLGEANGVASLDNSGKVPDNQLPTKAINAVQKTGDTMTGTLQINSPNNEIRMIHPDYPEYNGFIRRSTQNFIIGTKDGTTSEWKKSIQITDNAVLVSEPAASANDSQIATTKFVKSLIVTDKINTVFSNAITKIPQDINLVLSEGTLTLKAGSKLYIPNGSDVFNEVVTSIDYQLVLGTPTGSRTVFFVANSSNNLGVVVAQNRLNLFSGDTQPTASTQTAYWYDTANNVIKRTRDTGSSWSVLTNATLPICVATFNAGVATSIDQVFNGFGYIGSSVFSLPGVEGLIPNGRNDDGSLKNIEVVTNKVSVITSTTSKVALARVFIKDDGELDFTYDWDHMVYFDNTNNVWKLTNNNQKISLLSVCEFTQPDNKSIDYIKFYNVAGMVNFNSTDCVVERYYDELGNWYRVYKSGWVEQGGIFSNTSANPATISLFKVFANTNYTILTTSIRDGSAGTSARNNVASTGKTTTSFKVYGSHGAEGSAMYPIYWQACGQGA